METCPACSGLNDEALANALKQRKRFRVSLGKAMMIGAIIFFIAVIVMGKLIEQ